MSVLDRSALVDSPLADLHAIASELTIDGYRRLRRDELIEVVRKLEAGGLSLEESLALWERGEALAAHCQAKLDGARARLDAAVAAREEG
jgi:exodeoxyribonuclease VII small subunit